MATTKLSATKSTSRAINYAEKRIHNKRQPQMTNIGKSHQYINREKTPKWLDEKIYKQYQELHNEDAKLKQDREAFQRQLEEKWEE